MAHFSFGVSRSAEFDVAIASVNARRRQLDPRRQFTITLLDDTTLSASIAPFNLASGCSLTVTGNSGSAGNPSAAINGQGSYRGFEVLSGAATLDSLTLANTVVRDARAAPALKPRAAAQGLGGGVFVAAGASVALSNVNFGGDAAVGGAGGATSSSGVGAGGASSDGLIGGGGAGGFGGGTAASGGFGAGPNAGGGLGAGRDIFVEQGGTLTIVGGTLGAGQVSGGGAGGAGTPGKGFGTSIFIQGDQSVSIMNTTVSGGIADQAGSGGTGVGSVDVSGHVTLSAPTRSRAACPSQRRAY